MSHHSQSPPASFLAPSPMLPFVPPPQMGGAPIEHYTRASPVERMNQYYQQQMDGMQHQMSQMQQIIEHQRQLLEDMQCRSPVNRPLYPPPAPTGRGPKIATPEKFSGERGAKAENFLLQCGLYFLMRPNDFPNDATRIAFAISFLTDTAAVWGQPVIRDMVNGRAAHSWNWFKDQFTIAYGDADRIGTSTRALERLSQTGRVADYATTFRQYSVDVQWNDQALRDKFRTGLKDRIKDELARDVMPATFEGLVERAIRIDTRFIEREQERRLTQAPHAPFHPRPTAPIRPTVTTASYRPPAGPPPPRAPVPNAPRPPVRAPDAMDLDGNRHKLTPQERQHRADNKLCFYCGQAGHTASAHRTQGNALSSDPPTAPNETHASIEEVKDIDQQ